jgi:hypothetical protein
VSFDSSRAVSHWLLEHGCNVLCILTTVIRDGDICKTPEPGTKTSYLLELWSSIPDMTYSTSISIVAGQVKVLAIMTLFTTYF